MYFSSVSTGVTMGLPTSAPRRVWLDLARRYRHCLKLVVIAANTATTLGRYEVIKHLAQGGMAEVFLARARGIEGFERHVVIKRIRAEQARDKVYVQMFLDEARLSATLLHHT